MWWSPDIPQDLRVQHGVHILGRLLGEVVHGLTSLALTLQLEGSLAKWSRHSVSHLQCPAVIHCQRFAPEPALPTAPYLLLTRAGL